MNSSKKMSLKIAAAVLSIVLMISLCACGSNLDGTWTSQTDPGTKIVFSGKNVKVSYGSFKTSGTYETDDSGNAVFTLTDSHGNIYKVAAELTMSDDKTFILKNPNGEVEVFRKK